MSRALDRFIRVHEISAARITDITFNPDPDQPDFYTLTLNTSQGGSDVITRRVTDWWMNTQNPHVGGYYIEDAPCARPDAGCCESPAPRGFSSFMPASVFHATYGPVTKAGEKVPPQFPPAD